MSVDKAVDSSVLNAGLTSIANAIRAKGGTSASLAFPNAMVSAIQAITAADPIFPCVTSIQTINITNDNYKSDASGKRGTFGMITDDFIPAKEDATDHNLYVLFATTNTMSTSTAYRFFALGYWRPATPDATNAIAFSARKDGTQVTTTGSRSLYIGNGSVLKLLTIQMPSIKSVVQTQGGIPWPVVEE